MTIVDWFSYFVFSTGFGYLLAFLVAASVATAIGSAVISLFRRS